MSIPDYQSIMLPLLKLAGANNELSLRESIEKLAKEYQISNDERKELLPSGQQPIFDNRVGWARTYLKKAGLLKSTRRGYFIITDEGKKLLDQKPSVINNNLLKKYSSFLEFQNLKKKKNQVLNEFDKESINPEEAMENAFINIKYDLAQEILQQVKNISPSFFEKLVLDVLLNMGYGGNRKNAGKTVGKTGDEGIDGIINEDRLGLDIIYIQAKRWENPVGRPEIQKFVGALQGQRARKGIFITTSIFTNEAISYVDKIENKVVLIDGNHLANLMIDFNVGVSPYKSFEIKRMDSDYFIEE